MADEPRIVISSEPSLAAEEIARRTFATSFRGYDPAEVRSFLRRVADEIAYLRDRETDLRRRLEEVQRTRAEPPKLDEAALMAALGEETARVLRSAREAAAEIVQKAEQKVARLVKEAQEEAARIREEAETSAATVRAAAEADAAAVRAQAEAEAAAVRERADAEAVTVVEEARATGREMLHEAQALRERVLADLARRRRLAQIHVEQLRAGRERLLEAYRVVRRTLDEVTEELRRAEVEARAAAEAAGRRAAAEAGATLEELEAELDARRSGGEVEEPVASDEEPPPPVQRPTDAPTAETSAPAVLAPDRPATAPEPVEQPPRIVRRAPTGELVELDVLGVPDGDEGVRVIRFGSAAEAGGSAVRTEESGTAEIGREETDATVPVVDAPAPPGADHAVPPDESEEATNGSPPAGAAPPDIEAIFARLRAGTAEPEAAPPPPSEPAGTPAGPPLEAAGASVGPTVAAAEPIVADADEARLQARDELLEPLDTALVRRLKRVLQDEQNAVLDGLRTHRGPAAPEVVLPDVAAQAGPYRREAVSLLAQAAEAGAAFVSGSVVAAGGVDVESVAAELAAELLTPLRERVGRALAGGAGEADVAEADVAEADVAEAVSAAYREWRTQRVEPAARHAVATAFSAGTFSAIPDGALVRWLVDDDGAPCPDCDDNALAGPIRKGEPFPTGQPHPPAHPGCRCLLVVADG